MKKNFVNEAEVRGIVFDHDLKVRTTSPQSKTPGVNFITGSLWVATDESCTNVVKVHFPYTTEFYKSGKPNDTYSALEGIIAANNIAKTKGVDAAARVRISGEIETNEFYNRDDQLVSNHRVRGRFLHFLSPGEELRGKATFKVDALLTNAAEHEYPSGDTAYEVSGYVFGFEGRLNVVKFTVGSKPGIEFFENCDITRKEPYFGLIWGKIDSATITREVEASDENVGFGVAMVEEARSYDIQIWDVEGANTPLDLDEETVAPKEMKKLLAELEERRAAEKARQEAYRAQQGGQNNAFAAAAPAAAKKPSPTVDEDFQF